MVKIGVLILCDLEYLVHMLDNSKNYITSVNKLDKSKDLCLYRILVGHFIYYFETDRSV